MAANSKFGIVVNVDDSQLAELEKRVQALGGITKKYYEDSVKASSDSTRKRTEDDVLYESNRKKLAEQTAANLKSVEDRLNAARKGGIDSIRQSIFNFEEQKRKLALESAHTLDGIREREIKEEAKKINAELQLYRSLEKEQKGRTFTEQLEKSPKQGHGLNIGQITGIAVAVEGLNTLVEKSKEVADAQHQLQVGTGLSGEALKQAGKQAEAIGEKLGVSGDAAKTAMGKVASYTHATGDELKQQTEAVIAYAEAHGKSAERVARMLDSEVGRNKILAESQGNIARAQQAALDPARQAQLIQAKLTETIGMLAMSLLTALAPVLKAVSPLITEIGEVLSMVLKPIFDALTPVIVSVAKVFTDLANPIKELIENVLSLLTPILSEVSGMFTDIIPVITDIVKVVIESLSPVFKALAPIIMELVGIFKAQFLSLLQGEILPMIQDVFVPILRDLLVPVLMSLMPLIKLIADIASSLLVPAFNTVGKIMKWVIDNAISPLVKWLSGTLVTAIQAVIGVAEKVIGAIKTIASAVGSILGLGGDEPKKAVQKQTAAVVDATQQGLQEVDLVKQKEEEKAQKRAELEAKRGATAAKKELRDVYKEQSQVIEDALTERKSQIDTENAKGLLSDKDAKRQLLEAERQHAEAMVVLATQQHQKVSQLKATLAKDEAAIRKNDQAQVIEDNKSDTEELLAQLELRGEREGLSEKAIADEKYTILRNALAAEITIRAQYGDDVSKLHSKLQEQLALMKLKHRNEQINDARTAQEEIEKQRIESMRAGVDKEVALQEDKYKKELTALRKSLEDKKITSEQYDALTVIEAQKNSNAIKDIYKKQGESYMQDLKDANVFVAKNAAERFAAVKGFLLQELSQYIITKYAEVAATEVTEGQKSAITLAGIAQRIAATAGEVASDIASAAAAAFTGVANLVRWIFTTIPFPFSLAVAGAGVAAGYGLYEGVKKLFKFAEGGIVDTPQNFTFGKNGEFSGQRGEAGKEAIIPLSKLPSLIRETTGYSVNSDGELVKELRSIHETFKKRPSPAIVDQHNFRLSLEQGAYVDSQRNFVQ